METKASRTTKKRVFHQRKQLFSKKMKYKDKIFIIKSNLLFLNNCSSLYFEVFPHFLPILFGFFFFEQIPNDSIIIQKKSCRHNKLIKHINTQIAVIYSIMRLNTYVFFLRRMVRQIKIPLPSYVYFLLILQDKNYQFVCISTYTST